jgi:hypothetical protein
VSKQWKEEEEEARKSAALLFIIWSNPSDPKGDLVSTANLCLRQPTVDNFSCHSLRGNRARGGHGLSKVSTRLARLYLSKPCGRATHKTALRRFRSSTPLDIPRRTTMSEFSEQLAGSLLFAGY